MNLFLLLVFVVSTWIGSFGALFLKRGAARFDLAHLGRTLATGALWLGGALYLVGIAVYLYLLKFLPLSIAYPLTSMSYIWIAFLSRRYLNEEIDAWRWTGIGLIIAGTVLLSIKM